MSGDLRAIGLAHGLMLGLALACPLVAPDLLPWAVDALLLVGGFHLRLTDRRLTLRSGGRDWISHIRMAPTRLLRWAAAAMVAFIAGHIDLALAIILAALACELLAYPLTTLLIGGRPLPWAMGVLALLIIAVSLPGPALLHLIVSFLIGVTACMVWLRGPDGEPRALMIALGGGVAATASALFYPGTLPFAVPTLTICAAWTLAHLSLLRRPVTPWRLGAAPISLRRAALRLPLP
jgi:hypothetical protein